MIWTFSEDDILAALNLALIERGEISSDARLNPSIKIRVTYDAERGFHAEIEAITLELAE